jgi:hypothetical protein
MKRVPSTPETVVHVGETAPGLVETYTWPEDPVATQSDVEAHETSGIVFVALTTVLVQAPGPPDGSVDDRTLPLLSVATQRDSEGQEAPEMPLYESTTPELAQGPAAGVAEVKTVPSLSAIAHSEIEGQDTPVSVLVTCVGADQVTPFGSVDVRTLPLKSIRAQSGPPPIAVHDTPVSMFVDVSTCVTVQAPGAPVGFVDVTTLPPKSVATQRAGEAHEM